MVDKKCLVLQSVTKIYDPTQCKYSVACSALKNVIVCAMFIAPCNDHRQPGWMHDADCCTSDSRCEAGEGGCLDNSGCLEGLFCGIENCPTGFDFGEDPRCCEGTENKMFWIGCVKTNVLENEVDSTAPTNFSVFLCDGALVAA